MDRFIEDGLFVSFSKDPDLKSNMDRFIDADFDRYAVEVQKFKIQYG